MIDPNPLRLESSRAVVQQLDDQILACVEDESLAEHQQSEPLAWVHARLLSAYVADLLDLYPGAVPRFADKELLCPCRAAIETIGNMLQGGIPLGAQMTFECPPPGCPRALALSRKLPAWLRRRIGLAAQRTRLHSEAELTALWETVEEHLLTGVVVWFDLGDHLEVEVPTLDDLDTATRACLEAVRVARGLAWIENGAIL